VFNKEKEEDDALCESVGNTPYHQAETAIWWRCLHKNLNFIGYALSIQWRNQDFSSSGQTSLVSKKIDGQNGR